MLESIDSPQGDQVERIPPKTAATIPITTIAGVIPMGGDAVEGHRA